MTQPHDPLREPDEASSRSLPEPLPRLEPRPRNPEETFTRGGSPLPFALVEFWRWSCSDLLSNATRGILAEFLVARALEDARAVRDEWDVVDVRTPDGIRVEVKTSAWLQSWHQERLSTISFGIAPTRNWDPDTNTLGADAIRAADVYVFCLLDHTDKATVDPLDLDQWRFFVLSTARLEQHAPAQKRISLSALEKLGAESVQYEDLEAAVRRGVGPSDRD